MPQAEPAPTFVTAQELLDLADHLPDTARSLLEPLAARQAAATAAAPVQAARKLLGLVESLGDYDDQAASHLLIGLLRIASDARPLSVERTALRIAGLATVAEDQFFLTPEGRSLVQSLSLGLAAFAEPDTQTLSWPSDPPSTSSLEAVPFAQIRCGEKLFEIADGPIKDSLAFRLHTDKNWVLLDLDRSAGWADIGAEILTRSSDVVGDYISMHTVRLLDPSGGPDLHRFDLGSFHWWVRVQDGKPQLRLSNSEEWLDLPDDPKAEPIRSIGIRAAQAHIPDFATTIRAQAAIWVRRMAHAASVTPILSGAA